jgi:hypothetical protein
LIPTSAPNPFWIGAAQLYITSASANVFNQYLGQMELTNQPLQTFIRPTFTIPAVAAPALAGDHNDVQLTIVVNVNAGTQGWLLNDLRINQ